MADKKVSEELSSAIEEAVQREVSRVLKESISAQVEAAERGIRLAPPMDARYVIYWTAAMR